MQEVFCGRYTKFQTTDRPVCLHGTRIPETNLKTNEETLRTRERIRARDAQRHKARDKVLPVGQRPVKRLWLLTAVFSVNFLLALSSTWMHRFALLGLLHYIVSAGSTPFHGRMWDFVSVFNVFMFPMVLISSWTRTFQSRAERRRVREQRRAMRASGRAGVWPPPPRM